MRTSVATLLICLVLIAGCDGLLDTEPFEQVSPEVALSDINGIENLALSAYTRMQSFNLYGNLLILGPETLADNAISRQGTSRYRSHVENQVGAHMGGVWGVSYLLINEANTVMASLDELNMDDPAVTQARVDRIRGEMLFMRALAHHNLVKVFGYEPGREVEGWDHGVIIRTEPTRGLDEVDFRPRNTNAEVYTQIKSDLEDAISLLDGNDRGDARFANHAAALALRARVALYEEDWEAAENFATQAMAASGNLLVEGTSYADGSSSIFDSNPNPESLFEVAISTSSESLGVNSALSPYLLPRQWHANVPPQDFIDLFEEGDVRLNLYPFHEGNNAYYTVKYNESNDIWTDSVPVIRYPELLLIRAEARNEQDDLDGALEDLNTLREARFLEDDFQELATGSQTTLRGWIERERRLELAYEGHRFFDLKRRGQDIRKSANTPANVPVPYNDYRILAPLPSSEVNLNEQLLQNPGY